MKYVLSLNIFSQENHFFFCFSCWMLKVNDIPNIYFRNMFWSFTMLLFEVLSWICWNIDNINNDLQREFWKCNRKIRNRLPFYHPNSLIIEFFISQALIFKKCSENILYWIVTWNLSCYLLLVIKLPIFKSEDFKNFWV